MRYECLCSWILAWLLVFLNSAALDPLATGLVILPLPQAQGRPSFRRARELQNHKSRWHTALNQNDGYPSDRNNNPPLTVTPLMALALEESLFKVQALMNMSDNADNGALWWNDLLKNCQESVQLGPSSRQGAGTGLFARKNLDLGALVSFYPVHGIGLDILGGTRVAIASSDDMDQAYFDNDSRNQQQSGNNYRQYLIHGDKDLNPILSSPSFFIDVNPNRVIQDGWMSHCINDGATIIRGESIVEYYTGAFAAQNCLQIPFGPSPLMATVTTSRVEKGKELFTCYGSAFWLAETGGHKPMETFAIVQQQQCLKLAASKTRAAIENARTAYSHELECMYSLWEIL
jgi:hypothetical protein